MATDLQERMLKNAIESISDLRAIWGQLNSSDKASTAELLHDLHDAMVALRSELCMFKDDV